MLDVAPASITHILSGRNKPSYDFVVKLVEAFPQYDARWLITGKGEPKNLSSYSQADVNTKGAATQASPKLFNFEEESISSAQHDIDEVEPLCPKKEEVDIAKPRTRLIVCHPDNTFTEYTQR